MNYRHAFHAGNFADVFKHAVLTRVIEYLKRKDGAFRIHDTHAGRGQYALSSVEAARTGEWIDGIGRVAKADLPAKAADLLQPYLDAVGSGDPPEAYPGSPLIARRLIRKQDRMSLCELHPEDYEALSALFAGDFQTRVNRLDGWLVAGAHLPPKEARGVVLVDPPFEQVGDFHRIADAMVKAHRRWPGGTVLAWYPVKDPKEVDRFVANLRKSALPDLLRAELRIGVVSPQSGLAACGLIVKNPPYVLSDELRLILPALTKIMARDGEAGWKVEPLSEAR
jgi:23S rRNA (adenine2030-N6)-methyltransferase